MPLSPWTFAARARCTSRLLLALFWLGSLACTSSPSPEPSAATRVTTQEAAQSGSASGARGDRPLEGMPSHVRLELESGSEIDLAAYSREELFAFYNRMRGDEYALDARPRLLTNKADELPCNEDELTRYDGTELPLLPVVVHPAFTERLRRLEHVAIEVGKTVYGRAPVRIRHVGAYVCRKSRFRPRRISEHALGNAIDIVGFDFGAAKPEELAEHIPRSLRWPFQVRVQYHWRFRHGDIYELHHEFLHRLAERVLEEEIFRVVLGPSHRGHENHFHFDMSPWRYDDL